MIRAILVWLGIWIASVAAAAATEPTVEGPQQYHDEEKGFRIAIPRGWVTIPQSEIQKMRRQVFQGEAAKKRTTCLAMQLKSRGWFEYPYVTVEVNPYPVERQPSEREMKRAIELITGREFREAFEEAVKEDVRELVGEIVTDRVQLLLEEKRFIWENHIDVSNFGRVRGYMVGYFGHRHLVVVGCCVRDDEFGRCKPVFDSIQRSFALDPSMQFQVVEWFESPVFAWVLIVVASSVIALVLRPR